MDYKRLYEQSLERARIWKEKSGMPKNKQGILDDIFPELAGSEDEQIRKELITWLQSIEGQVLPIDRYDAALAWLEKQGEQKPTQEIEPFEAEHGKYYYCIKDYFCGGRKQASKGDVVQALRGLPIMGLKDAGEYFLPVNSIKCNSAWSEEDEKIFGRICALIHSAAYKNYDVDEDGNECGEYANIKEWFKKFKDRVQLQNITVTDEELVQAKKDAYNDALDKIEYHSGEPTFDDGWSAAIWYLKKRNAQPQNRWKPSDEQIEILDMVLTNESMDDNIARILRELREQLKKLREE